MVTITVDIPIERPKEDVKKIAKTIIAIELFRQGFVSIGKAAEISGLPYQVFIAELIKKGIFPFQYEIEDLEDEV